MRRILSGKSSSGRKVRERSMEKSYSQPAKMLSLSGHSQSYPQVQHGSMEHILPSDWSEVIIVSSHSNSYLIYSLGPIMG